MKINFNSLKVYHYFWLVTFLILLIGFFGSENTIDINVRDTYYVMSQKDATLVLSIVYFLLGSGYWLVLKILKKPLIEWLTIIHSIILIGSFVCYWLMLLYVELFLNNSFPLFDNSNLVNQTLMIAFLLISFIGTPIYFINLLIGIFRKTK